MEEDCIKSEILKVDRRGRVRVPRVRRNMLLDEFERCGVSARQFAERIGVRYQTFATWKQKRDRQRQAEADSSGVKSVALPPGRSGGGLQWVEAVVERSDGDRQGSRAGKARLAVSLPGGARMEIDDAGQVVLAAELLRMLEIKGRVQC
jgi:DNA-binding transcriptional regulator/RsmH inhibitor MraZ